jgi:hypothetical protein
MKRERSKKTIASNGMQKINTPNTVLTPSELLDPYQAQSFFQDPQLILSELESIPNRLTRSC